MYCAYCNSHISRYPDTGICPNCGGPLPPKPQQPQQVQSVQAPTIIYQVQAPVHSQVPLQRGVNCCGRCLSINLASRKVGFRWGLAILGFFLLPFFGLFLGFCGSKKRIYTCRNCGFTWKR